MFKHMFASLTIVALVAWTLAMAGCANETAPPAEETPTAETAGEMEHMESDHDHAGHDHAGHDHASGEASSEVQENLAKLSPELRQLAEKQEICPVSGEPLGSMGVPYKVTVKGRDVLLCCQGCQGEIQENPDQYLAKLSQE